MTISNWPQEDWLFLKEKIIERWPKLDESDLDLASHAPDMLVGRLQEHYELTREEAEKELHIFLNANLTQV